MTITASPYTDAQRARLRAFIMDLEASGARGCWHAGDLAWGLFLMSIRFDLAANVRLWQDEQDRIVGFAWFNPSDCFLLMQVRPGEHQEPVSEAMLAWGRGRHAETVSAFRTEAAVRPGAGERTQDVPLPLTTSVFECDVERIAWLEGQGLKRGGRSMVLFRQLLAWELPAPRVPEGFAVRPIAGDHEVAQRAAAHRETFHPSRVTDEEYYRLRPPPEYDPDLDLVAVTSDGTVGAFCLCWLDPVNKIGLFEPVGTRPTFRRQGLAQAVLAEGLRRMKAMGMKRAFVCTNYTNAAAQNLYQTSGFDIFTYDIDFSTA
jgi:ribosomal protein S18 acetylase RimI-like enzyme